MDKVEITHPNKKAATGSYSSGVVMDGWLYISGHCSQDLESGAIIHGSIGEETRRALEHIGVILERAGCTFDDVVKCACHLADLSEFDGFDAVYREFFPGVRPARTTVQSGLWDGAKVELDAIARLPQGKR